MRAEERPVRAEVRKKRRIPWVLLLLLIASIYAFWILPRQLGPRPPKIEFDAPPPSSSPAAKPTPQIAEGDSEATAPR